MKTEISFARVKGSEDQITDLYDLLSKRVHNISHRTTPDYSEHKAFVLGNPYRAWYLVYVGDDCVGSCYVMDTNCISVFLIEGYEDQLRSAIEFIVQQHKPLEELKSVRPPNFFINVPAGNTGMKERVSGLGWTEVQTTYALI